MTAECWQQVQTLFEEAVELSLDRQISFLKEACGGNLEVLSEVRRMLEEDSRADSILHRGFADFAYRLVGLPMAQLAAREIGAYRVLEQLGEGGMGVVYLAERLDTGKRVAMKFLPGAGMSPVRRALFTREMRTLAQLSHPCIAAQYDAGTLPDGTPWFVMEYVQGEQFVEYCRSRQLPLESRLKLFRDVCTALEYLHLKGFVHRDLKPSNILVEESGTPKILDFGIARELSSEDETPPDLQIMTRAYAAPEWIERGIVDNSIDVYALGVIFHEIVGGQRPPAAATSINLREAAHIARVTKTSWRELEKICRKALNADPAERYQSVEALRRDVDHFLKSEPLEGTGQARWYHLERFVTRRRAVILPASLALLLFAGMAILFTMRLAQQRNLALAEAKRTKLVEHYLFNLLQGGDKVAGPATDLRVVTLLARGEQEAKSLSHEPLLQAEFYDVLGHIRQGLGQFDQAEIFLSGALKLRTAHAASPGDVADSLLALGLLRLDQSRLNDAESNIRKALTIQSAQSPLNAQTVAKTESALGQVMIVEGRYQDAIKTLRLARVTQSLPDADPSDLATTLVGLSDAYFDLSSYPEAEAWQQQALRLHQELHGRNYPLVALDLRNLGNIQTQTLHYKEAERDFREALSIQGKWYPEDHPEIADTQLELAQCLQRQGRLAEAEPLLNRVLIVFKKAYGEIHQRVAFVYNQLGMLASQQKHLDLAEQYDTRAVDIYRRTLGEKNQATTVAQNNLASVYLSREQYLKAEKDFEQVLAVLLSQDLGDTLNAGITRIKLGRALVRQYRYCEARPQFRQGVAIVAAKAGPSAEWIRAVKPDLDAIEKALGPAACAQ